MSTPLIQRVWLLLCIFPSIGAIIVGTLIALAFKYQPGGDPAVAFAISFTLAEGMMLASALGILATIKISHKTRLTSSLRILNIIILIASGFTGYSTFLKMVA
jgi:hypothetical protein